ncbi:MAG: hypothetical protein LBH32_11815 [Dysgonamonadaceae bacterium]|jgi:hypothetical protein|nr:hypothetical protein [Dysgonamonadaceae bacterium]
MANKSHYNSGHIAMNVLKKNGVEHSATINGKQIEKSLHGIYIQYAVKFLKKMPDNSVQLILIDLPYNLDLDYMALFWRFSISRPQKRRLVRSIALRPTQHQTAFCEFGHLVLQKRYERSSLFC